MSYSNGEMRYRDDGRLVLEDFVHKFLGRSLYPYQLEIAEAVLDSVFNDKGLTFCVLLARQMGKNEVSAVIEAYILTHKEDGTIVKAAPTYKPQIVTSRSRLHGMLEQSDAADRIWRSHGYIVGVAPDVEGVSEQAGPYAIFLSASPDAHIVGTTASLLLEVDEAQDVSVEKFNTDLRPMGATTNCTTLLCGTAWSDDTLLAQTIATNQELEERDGIRRNFHYDWRTLAALNPRYKDYVEKEIDRLGRDHVTIRTQYRLQPISGEGFLLSEKRRHILRGKHDWQDSAEEGEIGYYVAGIDVGGEARQKAGVAQPSWKHDSTVMTIGRVITNELDLPTVLIVHQVEWRGKLYTEQYAQFVALCEQWDIRRVVIDATGLGEALASFLSARLGEDIVVPFHFSRQSKSRLTYHMLNLIDTSRLKMYKDDSAPDDISTEAWKQLKLARYRVPGENLLDMYVSTEDGHDDYLISIALCCEAVRNPPAPCFDSVWIPPRPMFRYRWEGQY